MSGFAPQKYEHFALFDEESEKMQARFRSFHDCVSCCFEAFRCFRAACESEGIQSNQMPVVRHPEHLMRAAHKCE